MPSKARVYQLHAAFKQEMNAVDSNHFQDFPSAFIDDFLWGGHKDLIAKIVAIDGLEAFQRNRDFLWPLIKVEKLGNKVDITDCQKYKTYKYPSPTDYYFFSSISVKTECCKMAAKILPFANDNRQLTVGLGVPSDFWNVSYAQYVDNEIIIHTETEPKEVIITYIGVPERPYIGGYDSIEYLGGDLSAPKIGSPLRHGDVPVGFDRQVARAAIDLISNKPFNIIDDAYAASRSQMRDNNRLASQQRENSK